MCKINIYKTKQKSKGNKRVDHREKNKQACKQTTNENVHYLGSLVCEQATVHHCSSAHNTSGVPLADS
jgi:hypothetical protein